MKLRSLNKIILLIVLAFLFVVPNLLSPSAINSATNVSYSDDINPLNDNLIDDNYVG